MGSRKSENSELQPTRKGGGGIGHSNHDAQLTLLTKTCSKCKQTLHCNLSIGKFNDSPDLLQRAAGYVRLGGRC
jgi:hypothetical protein